MRAKRSVPNKKPRFAFIVEGECEFWYIQMLKRNEPNLRVALIPEIPQKKKLKDQFSRVKEAALDYDKVFWIIDLDIVIDETQKLRKGNLAPAHELNGYLKVLEAKFSNVIVIVNNHCFEFWILLHFEMTGKFFDRCNKAQSHLKKHLPDYQKSQVYFTKQNNDIYLRLKTKLEIARNNAQRLSGFDLENLASGICEMHKLFDQAEFNP